MAKELERRLCVGTAGWALPATHRDLFQEPAAGGPGTQLARYATRLCCVEVNSSFYKPHRRVTWERWAASTPPGFRFAVKLSKAITHTARLVQSRDLLAAFLDAAQGLGEKLGPVLVQLPPSLAFDGAVAGAFFAQMRELHAGPVALEPRHASWFAAPVDDLLLRFEVARVAADPAKGAPGAGRPGGWPGLRYWRLHGTPHTYYSNYDEAWLADFAARLQPLDGGETWVVFDNTALGHATANAVALNEALRAPARVPRSDY